MCTWNKRHPDLLGQIPGEQILLPETSKCEGANVSNVEKTSVEHLLDCLRHLHV